ncbi:hypothetical protein HMPREF1981_01062 [Bacteroides pyogenes F0041]|uniref:Uncharacterized protein n=1 Tax=Bacteroides pyogenes F0041 TaxID=1321819 RepID=U2CNZ0_9BACE|nr:hypothetical protein HMPREF1981_01062 [Bacteroides pyogenes F0041]
MQTKTATTEKTRTVAERNMKVRSERHEMPTKETRTLLKKVWTAAERNMKVH